jgi:hypothetical protein
MFLSEVSERHTVSARRAAARPPLHPTTGGRGVQHRHRVRLGGILIGAHEACDSSLHSALCSLLSAFRSLLSALSSLLSAFYFLLSALCSLYFTL